MIPFKNLLEDPENYQPLATEKGWRNRPNEVGYTNVDIFSVFVSDSNQALLANSLYQTARQNGNKASLEKFFNLIPLALDEFCKKTDISGYAMAEDTATGIVNWTDILRAVNNDFLKFCYNLLKWNTFNPFRSWVEVGDAENRRQVRMQDVLADDIPTINVWATQDTQRENKNFRYENKIPVWQWSMNTRHYDKSNEGFACGDPDRASLDNPIYGYDMKPIYKVLDNWTKSDWFGN